jgi:hypothetical protein
MQNKQAMFQLDSSEVYNKYLNAAQERKMTAATTPTLNSGHNIHLALFEDTIYDYMRRDVSIYNWVPSVEATGQPTMWFEQTKNPANEQFSSPTTLTYKAVDDDYGRVPKSAMIKCITSKFSFPFFNTLVARQQGVLPDFVQKDIADWAWSFKRFVNKKMYYGTDTDLATPTTNEYMGIMTQITNAVARLKTETTTTILDVVEDAIANMESDVVNVTGTAADLVVFMNPKTRNKMVKEERARNSNFRMEKAELIPGFNIPGIDTAKGIIPIVADPFIDVIDNTANVSYDHPIMILNKRLIERRYIGAKDPMVFDWNMGNDQLSGDKLAVLFDNIIVRGASFGHVKINYQLAK